jgi:signal transduction histidine kinase
MHTSARHYTIGLMMSDDTKMDRAVDTVGELRALYRAAEARAASLRLLFEASRELSMADQETLKSALATAAHRAALFVGAVEGHVVLADTAADEGGGLELVAPGAASQRVGTLVLQGAEPGRIQIHPEDQGVITLLRQLMAAAIDRARRDQERDQLVALLQERERRLEAVVAALFTAQEDERRRISRELHDSVAQTAGALFRQIEAQKSDPSPQAMERLAILAQSVVRELRSAIADLRPTAIDDLGVVAAIAALADELARDSFDVEFQKSGPARWPALLETAFFRVAQEALNNIRRHAGGPCRVQVRVFGDPDRNRWRLEVRDWGGGLRTTDPSSPAGEQIGLDVMKERMAALGGVLSLASPKDGGFEVIATLGFAP